MGIFVDIITHHMNSLSFVPTGFFFKRMKLQEAYGDLTFPRDKVISSLYKIKKDLKSTKKDDVLFDINNEFLCVGIRFREYNSADFGNNLKQQYPQAGIVGGYFDPNTNFINILISDSFITKFLNEEFEDLADGIIGMSTHENIHDQQILKSKGLIKGLNPNNKLQTKKEIDEYLSSPEEIDANAGEFARFLYNLHLRGSQIGELIRNHNKTLFDCKSYQKYWESFGIITLSKDALDKDGLWRLKIWKRFLKNTIAYLHTTLNYYGSLDSNKTLKNVDDLENKQK